MQRQTCLCGGDDVLAFVPVETALKAAEMLRLAFADERQGLGSGATASFGVVIAHKKAPLQHVFNAARALEQKAKRYYNDKTAQRKRRPSLSGAYPLRRDFRSGSPVDRWGEDGFKTIGRMAWAIENIAVAELYFSFCVSVCPAVA